MTRPFSRPAAFQQYAIDVLVHADAAAGGATVTAWPHPTGPVPIAGPGSAFVYGPPAIYQIGTGKPRDEDEDRSPSRYPHAAE